MMKDNRSATDMGFSVAVALVALLPRLFVALYWTGEPVWDGHYYHFGAERIAAGLGYSEDVGTGSAAVWRPWSHYPVGYSALLAAAYAVFGAKVKVAAVVNALVGSLTALTTHRVARSYLSPGRAQLAAALVALHPGLIAHTGVLMTETLSAWLVLLSLAAALRYRAGARGFAVPGLVVGLATLVRPASLLTAPLLTLVGGRRWLQASGAALLFTLVALATVLPWTVRNCVRMDGCALVSTNGGWNLAIGALSETGRFKTLRASDGCPVVTGQVQQDRCWASVGAEAIRRDPLHWLALAPKKLAQTFDHESFAVEYLHEADPHAWPEPRRQAARLLFSNFHRVLLLAALLSAVALVPFRKRLGLQALTQTSLALGALGLGLFAALSPAKPFYLLLLVAIVLPFLPLPGRPEQSPVSRAAVAFVAATALVHVVFFGDDRYHIVVVPELCLLAAAALRAAREAPSTTPRSATLPDMLPP